MLVQGVCQVPNSLKLDVWLRVGKVGLDPDRSVNENVVFSIISTRFCILNCPTNNV